MSETQGTDNALDIKVITDEHGHRRFAVMDQSGVCELADEIAGLSPAAQERAAELGLTG